MKVSIFIRTYSKDLVWLDYALRSIHKHAKGFYEIVVCIPENQKDLLSHLTAERVVTCPVYQNDYIGQQISKLNAHKYCKGDYILFTDSDCIFTEPFTPEDFMRGGKPILLKTLYSKVGDAKAFQGPTEKCLRFKVDYEYMRRHPSLYLTQTIRDLHVYFNSLTDYKQSINDYILSEPIIGISEFNIIGAFTDRIQPMKYCIINTDDEVPPAKLKQYWSWSGLTVAEKIEIENLLK